MKAGPLAIGVRLFIAFTILIPGGLLASETGEYVYRAAFPSAGEYRIVDTPEGTRINMDGYNQRVTPGEPILPSRNVLIALPPGARVQSVVVEGSGAVELPGTYRIAPSPPIMPFVDQTMYPDRARRMWEEWRTNRESVFGSDTVYPSSCGMLIGSGTLRKYAYASVSLFPFRYRPQSGRLIRYDAATVKVRYLLPSPGSPESERVAEQLRDNLAEDRASKLFANYADIEGLYRPGEIRSGNRSQETYDYVIVTTNTFVDAITSSRFLIWKEALGHRVRFVLTTDPEIAGQPGHDLAEQIRNFLRSYYMTWGIEYVLLVGNYLTIPMRYCYPDSTNHWNNAGVPNAESGEVPTDMYYADLSSPDTLSWDLDRDGFYGEFGQDMPDLLADVYVGRIPTNNLNRVTYTLDKLVAFEQDTGTWKDQALHAGAIWYFTNEDRSGYNLYDGATCMDLMETDLMKGWSVTHFSEREGLEPSTYEWDPLSLDAFADAWREGEYSLVNWGAHGWTNSAARKIWAWDDGDGVPESTNPNEMAWSDFINIWADLDDDHPAFVFAISCVIGYPETNLYGNIGIDLLTEPDWGASIGVVSATRVTWGAANWPTNPGGGESMCYEFNRYIIDGPDGPERAGDAVYDSKYFCYQNYGFYHYAEYWNQFNFNLYGEPTLLRAGIAETVIDDFDPEFAVLNGPWNPIGHPNALGDRAHFTPPVPEFRNVGWRVDAAVDPGRYGVYVWKVDHEYMPLMATNAPYRVYHRTGVSDRIYVDQSSEGTEWVYLGSYEFDRSRTQGVMLTNEADGFVVADAIKLVYEGGSSGP